MSKKISAKEITRNWLEENNWEISGRPIMHSNSDLTTPLPKDSSNVENGHFLRLEDWILVGADFSGLDLKFAVFEKCDLSSVSFNHCNLFKATFNDCILYNATFNKATLTDVKFTGSKLFGIRLQEAEIHGLGNRGIGNLISREYWSVYDRSENRKEKLMFRGTAGYKEWNTVLQSMQNYLPNGFAFNKMHRLPKIDTDRLEEEYRLVPGVNLAEIVEILPLYSKEIEDRLKKRDKATDEEHLLLNIPNPPGDAFPEDSTGMMLRGFRKCFEKQGNIYPASEFRFWENTYLTASKWRTIQSKIRKNREGEHSLIRRIYSIFPAFIAWSLLHFNDGLRNNCMFCGCQRNNKKQKVTSMFQGEGLSGLLLHISLLYLIVAIFFLGLVFFNFWGFSFSIIFWTIFFVIPFFLVIEKTSINHQDNFKERVKKILKVVHTALKDLMIASIEFMKHTTCGYGERPLRALMALCSWIILFGFFFGFMGLSYNSLEFTNQINAIKKIEETGNQNEIEKKSFLFNGFPYNFEKGLYFSVMSATTVGFGDMSPSNRIQARLVCIEIGGALFLTAIFLASITRRFIGR